MAAKKVTKPRKIAVTRRQPETSNTLSRSEQKANTREKVLRAALDVFSEHGYEAASTALIAKKAGVSHGTVFVVAPTKESLAVAAFEDAIRARVVNAFLSAPEPAPIERKLEHVFTSLFDYYAANPPLSRALLKHLTFLHDPDAQKQYRGLVGEFIFAIERRFAQPEVFCRLLKDVSTIDAAQMCFAVYLFSLLMLLNDAFPDRKTHAATFRRQLNATLRGILSAAGSTANMPSVK